MNVCPLFSPKQEARRAALNFYKRVSAVFPSYAAGIFHSKAVLLVQKERISLKKALALMQVLFLARPARFERATFRLGGGRSILLSYGDIYQQLFYLILKKESITLCGRDEIYLGDGAGY